MPKSAVFPKQCKLSDASLKALWSLLAVDAWNLQRAKQVHKIQPSRDI